MPRLLIALALTSCIAFASPALAKSSKKFESSLNTPVNSVKVEVVLSEGLNWRANNLPKDRRERGNSRHMNDGFANNGFYGERDLNRLTERLERRMTERLTKYGIEVNDNASQVLRVVLTDAKPNRPTFGQLSKNSSLSHRSFGLGGASFEGELTSANGESSGNISYSWYESDIRDAQYGGTWSDAYRAIDRFAKKTAKSLN